MAELLVEQGISSLMPIQVATAEVLRAGHDVIARAKTGTGKTLAFVFPLLERLVAGRRTRRPRALILEPTRELAQQVGVVLDRLASGTRLRHSVIYGGASYERQRSQLQQCDIVVATPGRLQDMVNRKWLDLADVQVFVIDEADRMLDLGFADDVTAITKMLPAKHQTVMFSATMPEWCRDLAADYMRPDTVTVDLVSDDDSLMPPLLRHAHVSAPSDPACRPLVMDEVIKWAGGGRTLIFGQTKDEVESIAQCMPRKAVALHGGMTQPQRERVMAAFRRGQHQVMVATDVASRGLDIQDVKIVIQVRPRDGARHPINVEAYVHRAGRAARAGQDGVSVVIHAGNEVSGIRKLERECGIKFEHLDLRTLQPSETDRIAFRLREKLSQEMGGGGGGGGSSKFRGSDRRSGGEFGDRRREFGGDRSRSTEFGDRRREFGDRRGGGASSNNFSGSRSNRSTSSSGNYRGRSAIGQEREEKNYHNKV